jgi:hypothetical protein
MINNLINHIGYVKWELEYTKPTYNSYNNGGFGYTSWEDYGSSWQRGGTASRYYSNRRNGTKTVKSSSQTETHIRLRAKKLQGFLLKGFKSLNVNELKSFVDTLKMQTALTKECHPIQTIESIMPASFVVADELGLCCDQCSSKDIIETNLAVDYWYEGSPNDVGDLYCMKCSYAQTEFYECMKERIAFVKKLEQSQMSITEVINEPKKDK